MATSYHQPVILSILSPRDGCVGCVHSHNSKPEPTEPTEPLHIYSHAVDSRQGGFLGFLSRPADQKSRFLRPWDRLRLRGPLGIDGKPAIHLIQSDFTGRFSCLSPLSVKWGHFQQLRLPTCQNHATCRRLCQLQALSAVDLLLVVGYAIHSTNRMIPLL